MKAVIMLILISILFASCDCMQMVSGVVYDSETKMPIDNVAIGFTPGMTVENSVDSPDYKRFSDAKGKFTWQGMGVGLIGCPRNKLYFIKEGYEMQKASFRACCKSNAVVRLKRQAIRAN